jgi:MFS family permease
MFRNKIPETLKPGCLCNGMKTPDHDYELHSGGTAKPGIQKLWIAAVISGTCVAAHDSAATWTMNIFTGSPLLLSLMSTVASLPFFLFTLPAGVLADKVNRQKLVCTINVCLAAKVFASGLGE